MSNYIDKTQAAIQTVAFVQPIHNPCLRSEEEGLMACKFNADIIINDQPFFLSAAFVFKTPDFWTVGEVVLVNDFWCFDVTEEPNKECIFSDEQKQHIISVLSSSLTYDKYSWFTKTITKEIAA